jgi:glycosyltransferase involved in cell wall biosynthesis
LLNSGLLSWCFEIFAFNFCMKLSVVICAHNPREDHLAGALKALRQQTLPQDQWELLLIDNGSSVPLAKTWDLSWQVNARHLREEKLGLTFARLCGIRESVGDLLVFVDDDNVLAPDYLEAAARLSEEWPRLAAWGGQLTPVYEVAPPPEFRKWLDGYFGRKLEREAWSNVGRTGETTPSGSGMVVRRAVADYYAKLVQSDPVRSSLGRTGESLTSCEDYDLAWTSHTLGFGTGLFPSLKLEHLVPPKRMTRDYILKLKEGLSFSEQLLRWVWNMPIFDVSRSERLYQLYRDRRLPPLEKAFNEARLRGERRGRELIRQLKKT